MSHHTLAALRAMDDAFTGGDFEAVLSGMTEDAKIHITGKSRLAGEYEGREAFGALMGQYMAALGEVTGMETHAMLADDDHGIQLQTITATKGGKTVTLRTINVFHFDGDKVSEMWSVDMDQHEADAFYDM